MTSPILGSASATPWIEVVIAANAQSSPNDFDRASFFPSVRLDPLRRCLPERTLFAHRRPAKSDFVLGHVLSCMAEAWGMEPMPLTIKLVDAVAASLWAGDYRSAAQIFSQVSQEHISRTGTNVPPAIQLRIQLCVRATERGRGPSQLKDSHDGAVSLGRRP